MPNKIITKEQALIEIANNKLRLSDLFLKFVLHEETGHFISHPLLNDPDVVHAAVIKNGGDLRFASNELKQNKGIVRSAVQNCGFALEYASDALKDDKEVVLAAVSRHGQALQYASENLKNDKEVVLAAVSRHGQALQYASENLKNDKEVVLVAVWLDGQSFKYASENLQNDRSVTLARVHHNRQLLIGNKLSDDLKNDMSFFWGVWCLPSPPKGQSSFGIWDQIRNTNQYLNEILYKEILKGSAAVIGVILGGLMLGGVIAFPIPAIATLAMGVCLTAMGAMYTSYQMYQHGVGFFNAKPSQDLVNEQHLQPAV